MHPPAYQTTLSSAAVKSSTAWALWTMEAGSMVAQGEMQTASAHPLEAPGNDHYPFMFHTPSPPHGSGEGHDLMKSYSRLRMKPIADSLSVSSVEQGSSQTKQTYSSAARKITFCHTHLPLAGVTKGVAGPHPQREEITSRPTHTAKMQIEMLRKTLKPAETSLPS